MKKSDLKDAFNPAPEGFENAVYNALHQTRRMAASADKKRRRHTGFFRLPILAALVTLLLAGSVTAGALLTRGGNTMQQEPFDTDKSMAVIGDTLYVTDGIKLISYIPGESDYVTLIDHVVRHDTYMTPECKDLRKSAYYIDLLLNIDGKLCGMNAKSGLLFEIGWENGQGVYTNIRKLKLQYNMCRGNNDDEPRSMSYPVVQDNTLYFIQYDQFAGSEYRVAAYDLKTGEGGLKKVKNVRLLAPYKDHLLLAVTSDDWGEATELCVYDPRTDTLKTVLNLSASGMQCSYLDGMEYSQKNDCAYLFHSESGIVYALPGLKNPEKAALISNVAFAANAYGRASALVEDTYFCAQDRKGLYARNIQAGYESPLVLGSLWGTAPSQSVLAAAASRSEMEVSSVRIPESSTLQELLLTRDDQYDIYMISTNSVDLDTLMRKGYAPAAPALDGLNRHFESLYPFLREAVSANGRMCAVPISITANASYYNAELLSRLGVSAPPASVPELIELLEAWANGDLDGADLGDRPMDTSSYRWNLITLSLSLYATECQARNTPFSLDDSALRAVLALIDGADTDRMDEIFQSYNDEDDESGPYTLPLFELNTAFSADPLRGAQAYGLSLTGDPASVACDVSLAIVNPFGKRQEEAWAFLNAYVESLPEVTCALLYPDRNEPIEMENWAMMRDDLLSLIAEFPDYEYYQEELAYYEEYGHWAFSAENIAAYRDLMQNAFVSAPGILENSESGLSSLISQYVDRSITLEQFIQEGNGRLQLMQRE